MPLPQTREGGATLVMSDFLYHNFDLLVEPAGAGYRARVVASPAGEGAVAFVAPFSAAELAGFPLVTPEPAAACDLGGRLHAAVLAGPVRDLWQRSLQAAQGAGSGLRLRLRLAAAPETAAWPWEYLFEAATREFTALSAGTPVVRYLDLPAAAAAVAAAPPLGMLVALAQPARYVPLDLAGTWQGLQAALAPLGEQIAVARLQPPTLSALQRHLRRQTCHILHFVGHGGVNAAGDGVTIWEDEAGQGCVVPAPILATLLRDARETPRLVMLNTCAGASSSTDDPFSGTAQALVQAGIPAVVAFQAAVTIQTALTCATELYGAAGRWAAGGCSDHRGAQGGLRTRGQHGLGQSPAVYAQPGWPALPTVISRGSGRRVRPSTCRGGWKKPLVGTQRRRHHRPRPGQPRRHLCRS